MEKIDKTYASHEQNNAHPHILTYPHNAQPTSTVTQVPITGGTHCIKEAEISRLEEKVKTLFLEHQKLNDTLDNLNKTQMELLTQITNLSSIINTLKWTLTVMVAIFGGLFVFIVSEIIKIIH